MNPSAIIVLFSEIKLFKALNLDQITNLARAAQFEKIAKNKQIYTVGSAKDFVYIIQKGSVKIGMNTANGRLLTKSIAYEHEIFGENIFTEEKKHVDFAESMSEVQYYKIPVAVFQAIIIENHGFAKDVMQVIVNKLRLLEDRLQNFVFRKAKERIVDFIYKSGLKKGVRIGVKEFLIDHGMSHKEISYLTDTSRQTVARILNELKKENFIHYSSHKSNKILIRDMALMANYSL